MSRDPLRPFGARRISGGLYVLAGAVNTGVLVAGERALLIDCCDSVTPDRLAALGVRGVEIIACTQHRRPNVAGAYPFVDRGAKLIAPRREQHLFAGVEAYWSDPANRWHIYHHQPGPQVLAKPIPVARAVADGDVIEWGGYQIRVLETPGATDGSVSYLIDTERERVCFSGDAIYGPGQMWNLWSLQKGHGEIRDYHGFLGNRPRLMQSLRKLADSGATLLIPSHGSPIDDPSSAVGALASRLDAAWRNYTAISSLNHYFPGFLSEGQPDSVVMEPVRPLAPPPHIRRVAYTSFAIVSESGSAFLIDCGDISVVDTLAAWQREGRITQVEACWISHYHDDHVDGLGALRHAFGCQTICDTHLAEIIEHPQRFFLPCISPHPATVDQVTQDGESWRWHEFELSAFHFPGQTYYGGGLLVEGRGARIFFAGDSGSPTGIDDHCPGNRNFLGEVRGFRQCLALWRNLQPDLIINQHQDQGFLFGEDRLNTLDSALAERERLYAEILPWPDPNFGTDVSWARTYPYEQEVRSGRPFWVDVQFTNHGPDPVIAIVEPVLPEGWVMLDSAGKATISVAARTDGTSDPRAATPDSVACLHVQAVGALPGLYVIPIRITWGSRYLGQYRHAIVRVTG